MTTKSPIKKVTAELKGIRSNEATNQIRKCQGGIRICRDLDWLKRLAEIGVVGKMGITVWLVVRLNLLTFTED